MAFVSFCKSDPLLKFIRDSYNAIPMKMPDARIAPLALFTVLGKRIRFLGNIASLSGDPNWVPPEPEAAKLPNVELASSRKLSFGTAVSFVKPFLGELLDLSDVNLDSDFSLSRKKNDGVKIAIGKANRFYIHPLKLGRLFERIAFQLPTAFEPGIGQVNNKPLYLVDSVLKANELILLSDGESSSKGLAKLEAALLGKLSGDYCIRSNTRLTINGFRSTPFALTCLRASVDTQNRITKLLLSDKMTKVHATEIAALSEVKHEALGEANELIQFDG